MLCLSAEGISYGLDFKKALKDSEDTQLVKFQGSPQVGSTAGFHARHRTGACNRIADDAARTRTCQGSDGVTPAFRPCRALTRRLCGHASVMRLLCFSQLAPLVQIVIQLQKFAEAVKRIKGAVGSVNDTKAAPVAKPSSKSAYSSDTMFGRDISSILSTDLTDIDPSVGGQPAHSPKGTPASTFGLTLVRCLFLWRPDLACFER